jgi:TolA-binding protein
MIPHRLRTGLLLATFLLAVAWPARGEPRTLVITDELQLGLADAFMAEGEYYRAITEYKKFLYFFPDAEQADYVRLQIGMAYYHGGECLQAIESFAKVRQGYPSGHYATAAFYEGVCRSKLKNPRAAQDNFERVAAIEPAAPETADALAGLSLAALDREDWQASRQALERLAGSYPGTPQGTAAREALPLVADAETRPRKSPIAAGMMSAIVPGSGYAYAGRPRDGLMAFLVNGLFIAGTVVAIDQDNAPAAVLVGGAGLPFYLGNIYGSADAARKWNLSIARDLRKELALRLDFHY